MKFRQSLVSTSVLTLLAVSLTACGETPVDTEPAEPAPTVTVTEESAPEPQPEAETTAPTDGVVGTSTPSDEDTFIMPNEIGKTLQAAQDDLQAVSGNPFFYSGSEDATGEDRGQLVDSGWKVCDQSPNAGTQVRDDEDDVLFYVVRNSEDCP